MTRGLDLWPGRSAQRVTGIISSVPFRLYVSLPVFSLYTWLSREYCLYTRESEYYFRRAFTKSSDRNPELNLKRFTEVGDS